MGLFPEVANMDACLVYNDATQTALDATALLLGFNQEQFATAGMHDNTTDNERITIVTEGNYLLIANYVWEPNANGWRYFLMLKNGTDELGSDNKPPAASVGQWFNFATLARLVPGDYVEVIFYQDSGSNLTVFEGAPYTPLFGAQQLST